MHQAHKVFIGHWNKYVLIGDNHAAHPFSSLIPLYSIKILTLLYNYYNDAINQIFPFLMPIKTSIKWPYCKNTSTA